MQMKNKKDLIPIVVLILAIPLWTLFDRYVLARHFPASTPAAIEQPAADGQDQPSDEEPSIGTPAETSPIVENDIPVPPAEEITATLTNGLIQVELTSLGGGIKSVTLLNYPEFNEDGSPAVMLNFSNAPALAYEGLKGLGADYSVNMEVSEDGRSAVFSKALDTFAFERTISLGESYQLAVKDRFTSVDGSALELPEFRLLSGRMENPADMKAMKGLSILGIDSYAKQGGINYWGRKLNGLFKDAGKPETLHGVVPAGMHDVLVDWVAVKNMFFTQIIRTEQPIATMDIRSTRDIEQKGVVPKNVTASLVFGPESVDTGSSLALNYDYYVGPKQYSILKEAGNNMEGVMEFETIGTFSWMNWLMEPARKILLWTLNLLNGFFHNYGVAIILLTMIVRILFWPLTHKSTEKMRENSEKMQLVQPKVKALQEKYKSNPVKLREETMKIYQEHGFNPMGMMGGCLPMFVQLPVFVALYTVLRNAIELRYAGFLWIADLSAPENLLMGKIPIVGALNILPLIMSASMVVQQKMSSPNLAAATPEQQQQQKMMMVMMPIMMLFFFYSMPSGLVLYWTTSNLLMIAQIGIRNWRKKRREA